jgi:hypothetical protein
MTTLVKSSLLALAGLAVGWTASSVSRTDRIDTSHEAVPASKPEPATKAGPRRPNGTATFSDVAACRAALFAEVDDRHPLLRRFERERALRRWLELDAASALAEARKDPRDDFAKELFRQWVQIEPRAALDALNAADRELAGAVARDFFLALMTRDPALAAAELERPKWKKGDTDWLGWDFRKHVLVQWMRSDPAAAIASFGPPGSKTSLNNDEQAMAVAWAEADFTAAWAHFAPECNDDGFFTVSGAMEMLAHGLLQGVDQAREIEAALADPAGPSDRGPRDQLAEAMAESDPLAALEWASSRPDGDALRVMIEREVAGELASSDPEAALAMWKSSGGKESYEDKHVLRECFAALAADDPAGAAARVAEYSGSQRLGAMGGVLTRVFADDPAAAEAQCRAWLADPALAADAGKAWAMAFSWGYGAGPRDPGPMLAAIPELDDAVDADVLSTWTKVAPEAAAAWIHGRLVEGKKVHFRGDYSNEGVLVDLATSRPEFTASWLLELPDSALRAEAAKTLAANWAAFDPAAADAWIGTLPPGPVLDAANKGRKGSPDAQDSADPFR